MKRYDWWLLVFGASVAATLLFKTVACIIIGSIVATIAFMGMWRTVKHD